MPRTALVTNLGEGFLYGVVNPYTDNGLIKVVTQGLVQVTYDNRLVSQFVVGETVTSGAKTGIVVSDVDLGGNTGRLEINHYDGEFVNNDAMTGGTSGTTADVNGTPSYAPNEITRDAGDSFADADDEVVVRAVHAVEGSGANTVITVARELKYDGQTVNFTVGLTVTGGTSLATGVIAADKDDGASGTLTLNSVTGTFQNNEVLTDSGTGAAVVDGALTDRQATFTEGDPPDEAKQVVVLGAGLSTTLITGGTDGNRFEILRGLPTFGATDYVAFVTGKTGEEGESTFEARDKGVLQHRKRRHDIERRLTINVSYLHDKEILSALLDQDSILILERDDDRQGTVTEQHFFLQARSNGKAMPNESEGGDISGLSIDFRFERAYTLPG